MRKPAWARPDPPPRRPRHTREQIAATALAIADAEGIDAVTMRRIATELGAGTMTLYHYVRSKADLVALMQDAIMAEQMVPDDHMPVGDWRAALTALAHHTRAMFKRHPWVLTGLQGGGGGGAAGPHALRHFEQSLAAVAPTGLPPADRLDIIAAVDDFVAGFVLKSDLEPGLESIPDDAVPEVEQYFDRVLAGGDYPHIAELLGGGDRFAKLRKVFAVYADPDRRFEAGLRRLLDGIAAQIARSDG